MLPRLAFALLLTLGLCGCTLLAPRDPLQIDLAGRPDGARAGRLRQLGGDYLQSLVGVEPARLRFGARGLQIQ